MRDTQCPCCGETTSQPLYDRTIQCTECGHGWLPPSLAPKDLKSLYGQDYFEAVDYANYFREEPVLKRTFRTYLDHMQPYIQQGADIFEIGCAYGFFLDLLRPHYKAKGIDIHEDALRTAQARGLEAWKCDISREIPRIDPVEAICIWDCIEHLLDPADILLRCRRLLRPGGYLFLTTGDLSSRLARLQGRNWRLYHPPTHLHYFTKRSLSKVLETCGFTVTKMRSVAQWHSLENIVGGIQLHSKRSTTKQLARFAERVIPRPLLSIHFPVPTGDILWLAAQMTPYE